MKLKGILVGIYALIILGGGVAGYVIGKSVPSLISSTVSGVLLLTGAYGLLKQKAWGFTLSLAMTFLLSLFFFYRHYTIQAGPRFLILGLLSLAVFFVLIGLKRRSRKV